MSEYHFGVGRGEVPENERARIDTIAERHGVDFCNPLMADGWRYWFSGPNRREPFDGQLARTVLGEVGEVRIEDESDEE